MSPRSTMSSMATISAEPQMRNLKKEVTRFVPTSLHVRRPDTTKPKPLVPSTFTFAKPRAPAANRVGKSADQACDEFLKEINDLLWHCRLNKVISLPCMGPLPLLKIYLSSNSDESINVFLDLNSIHIAESKGHIVREGQWSILTEMARRSGGTWRSL